MSGDKTDIKDEELLKQIAKEQRDEALNKMSSQYKRYWTTDDLNLLLQKTKDEVLGYFNRMLPMWIAIPQTGAQILAAFQSYDPKLTDFKKIIKYVTDWIDYNHSIKTEEEFETQFARAEKILYYDGITLPIILMFDYQVTHWSAVLQKPTFYSYYDPNYITLQGKGTFFIAFPGSISHLTDEELMVVLKHEFGHIVQGHCSVHSSDPFDQNYQNAAMDISINCGMTPKEQSLLLMSAQKLFGIGKYPCLSLIGPKTEGGFNIRKPVQPGAWTDALSSIRLYYKKDQNANQEQGEGEEQKIDEHIRVGDPVISRDKNNKIYGRVKSIDPITGDIAEIDEMTEEQFNEYGKQVAAGNIT